MKEIIKKKEIKGIFISILLIVLGIFLIMKPDEILKTLIQIMGIILLLCGVIDFMGYFKMSDEEKLFNYGIMKGVLELCIGILFIFKFEALVDIFSIIIGLIIIFINLFKLQLSLNLKQIENIYNISNTRNSNYTRPIWNNKNFSNNIRYNNMHIRIM